MESCTPMDLYEQIFSRASTRNFTDEDVPESIITDMEKFSDSVTPVIPGGSIKIKVVSRDEVKGMAVPKAPSYLMLYGAPGDPSRDFNAGYLGEFVQLWLYAKGYASRWLGTIKPKQSDPDFIIGMAFGKPDGPATRKHEDFDRKPLSEISRGEARRF